ncbi:hypothetical protein TWF106_000742 [Orbilia oligospora]|uniref:Uncharacterized protein n=1 Tax=Orbilia oligospora TaxID=2813651 RepID=A0A7C8QY10_ORBOL|nr:hypothetical protein TWF106_000742 [Orbilia oligospora]
MTTAINLGFGIEIESEIRPNIPSNYDSKHRFATLLSSNGLPAAAGTSKYPTDYQKWWITNDGSIRFSQPDSVSMESVSPVRNFNEDEWKAEMRKFWSSMKSMFEVQRNRSCGSHIHVAPWGGKFTLKQAKTIAFACCYYEPYVVSLMPKERRDNTYCQRNSRISPSSMMSFLFRNGNMATIARDIKAVSSTESLIDYMQGESRYVLWNFRPLANPRTGTIEFRGGRHLRGPNRTISWITFVVVFVMLALEEDLLHNRTTYTAVKNGKRSEVQGFWDRFLSYAERLGVRNDLPDDFKMMSEKESWSGEVQRRAPGPTRARRVAIH